LGLYHRYDIHPKVGEGNKVYSVYIYSLKTGC